MWLFMLQSIRPGVALIGKHPLMVSGHTVIPHPLLFMIKSPFFSPLHWTLPGCFLITLWTPFELFLFICLFVCFSSESSSSLLVIRIKLVLKRWLPMEGLVWRIWLLDWFQITCLNPVYHKFSQKLRRKAILSSSLRYVRNLLGPLVRIFSMSILLYNKFSLESPFLLLAALSWLLILAQTAPPQASARIFLPIPG